MAAGTHLLVFRFQTLILQSMAALMRVRAFGWNWTKLVGDNRMHIMGGGGGGGGAISGWNKK